MRIITPGKINDRLWLLGREDSSVYLLEGTEGSILINGGLSSIVSDLQEQFWEFHIDETKINKLLVLHSHFDHVGIIPFLKRRNPDMVIYASPRSLEIFNKPKAIEAINASNRYDLESNGLTEACSSYDLNLWVGLSGKAVSDGDQIELGDLQIRILETPGHSPCSISAYVPQLKALFPSDAAGIPCGEKIGAYGTSNFTKFEESLRKMEGLEVEYLCADHCGAVVGDEAARFIGATIEIAKSRRNSMLDAYRRTGSLDEAARELANIHIDEKVGKMVSGETFVESFRQMIMHVAGLGG